MEIIARVIKAVFWIAMTYPRASVAVFLLLLFYFAFIRRVRYDGVQETLRGGHKHVYTIADTGGTFFTNHRVIGVGELAKRRKKFGRPAWSWPLTIVVIVGLMFTFRALLAR